MEEVLGKWNSLSITEDEDGILGVSDEIVEKGREVQQFSLLAKLLTRRPFNREAFKRTMTQLWRVEGRLSIRVIESDVFLFSFEKSREGRRILEMEPWHFDNALVLLKEVKNADRVCWDDWHFSKFWVQVFNLPLSGMIRDVGIIIGKGMGDCLQVVADESGRCIGQYMRLRVCLDTSKPLRRGARVRLGLEGGVVWVDFKYERLPEFCFICGILGHCVRDCALSD